jgi:ABC-type transporter Mla subunit MlaD
MSEQAVAQIIPFPGRSPAPVPAQPDGDAQVRLVRALASLNAALAEQRTAIGAWRDSLATLKATTEALHTGLHQYRSSLDDLGTRVSALGHEANALEAWADAMLGDLG